jgi:hypothetical protein
MIEALSCFVLVVYAVLRLNAIQGSRRSSRWHVVEALGLVLIASAGAGVVGEWLLELLELALGRTFAGAHLAAAGLHAWTFLCAGGALVLVGLSRGSAVRLVQEARPWSGLEERRRALAVWESVHRNLARLAAMARTPEDFHQVKVIACAALVREGGRREVIPTTEAPGFDPEFFEQRFSRGD